MKSGSTQALIGANVNVNIAKVPLRVYKEAERKGDTGTMERSMGYFTEFSSKAARYTEEASRETLKEQREESRERELEREKALEEKRAEKKAERENDPVTISAETDGSVKNGEAVESNLSAKTEAAAETTEAIPKLYTGSGITVSVDLGQPVLLDTRG